MFLIHALKSAIEAAWHAMQIVMVACVLLAVVVFNLDMLDEEDADET